MMKHLLICLFLMGVLKAQSQGNQAVSKPSGKMDMTKNFIRQLKLNENQVASFQSQIPDSSLQLKEAATTTSINWNLLCGSMNVYGMLVNQTKPLQLNTNLDVVSFVHRKSDTYNPFPIADGNPGTIVAEISGNWGQTWDSTCIWAHATNGGRYPQGAIYSPMGNTNIVNAYVVGCGPVVANNAFTGDWYASKALGAFGTAAFNATPATVSNGQQFLSFSLPTYPINQAPHAWSMQGFSSTDDGLMRSIALIDNDNTDANTMRGAMIVKGTFNAGVFNWTTDSLIPNVIIKSDGNKQFSTKVQMAWNKSGSVGYAVIIGALSNAFGSNRGLQPIIYKTSNSGQTWLQVSGINFNAPTFSNVLSPLAGVETNSQLAIPMVDDFDLVVDQNNFLHMGLILASTFSDKDDSLQYISQFTTSINPSDEYKWKHLPGNRPYLYDFYGDGSPNWKYVIIDSLSSEGPGSQAGSSGFNDNPWDISAGDKIAIDSRLQMGVSPNGNYITFSWAESDSAFIPGSKKWNIQPNIKAKCSSVAGNSISPVIYVSNDKVNVSKPISGQGTLNPKVINRSTLHFMSPKSSQVTRTLIGSCNQNGALTLVEYKMPFTVTNSQPYSQLTNNTTWYTSALLSFSICESVTGIVKNTSLENSEALLYPNPASHHSTLKINLKENLKVQVKLFDTIGSELFEMNFNGSTGENNFAIDTKQLKTGIYFVNVNIQDISLTKKLIVE